MRRSLGVLFTCLCLLLPVAAAPERGAVVDLELTVDGSHFKVDGVQRFLVFVSYFDALDVSDSNIELDFQALKAAGVDGVRIMPNWWTLLQDVWASSPPAYYAQDTVMDHNGNLRSGSGSPLAKLLGILAIAKDEGLLVDLSFTAETVGYCAVEDPCENPSDVLTKAEFQDGLEAMATEIANGGSAYKHVLFDIQNEYNLNGVGGNPFSDSDIEDFRDAIKNIEPAIVVVASHSQDVAPGTAASRHAGANLDAIAWHEFRVEDWWSDPTFGTAASIGSMQGQSTGLPIYLQESERHRDSNDHWLFKEGFAQNVYIAKTQGAAAWTFHNSGSHRMNGSRLYSKLSSEELDFLSCLAAALVDGDCTPAPVTLGASAARPREFLSVLTSKTWFAQR